MTNISKEKTKSDDYAVAYSQLTGLIAQLDTRTSKFLLSDLLTESEQIMVIKRFASVFMFNHNFSPYKVSETLSISRSTARRLYWQYNEGKFNNLLGCIKKKEANKFLLLIQDLIMAQVSPRARARLMNRVL